MICLEMMRLHGGNYLIECVCTSGLICANRLIACDECNRIALGQVARRVPPIYQLNVVPGVGQ